MRNLLEFPEPVADVVLTRGSASHQFRPERVQRVGIHAEHRTAVTKIVDHVGDDRAIALACLESERHVPDAHRNVAGNACVRERTQVLAKTEFAERKADQVDTRRPGSRALRCDPLIDSTPDLVEHGRASQGHDRLRTRAA